MESKSVGPRFWRVISVDRMTFLRMLAAGHTLSFGDSDAT